MSQPAPYIPLVPLHALWMASRGWSFLLSRLKHQLVRAPRDRAHGVLEQEDRAALVPSNRGRNVSNEASTTAPSAMAPVPAASTARSSSASTSSSARALMGV